MLYSLVGRYHRFGGTCCCHIQGISCPENGGGRFVWSVRISILNCTASHPSFR